MTSQGREVGSKAEVPGGQKQQFGGKTFKMHTLRLQEGTSFPHLRSDRREQFFYDSFPNSSYKTTVKSRINYSLSEGGVWHDC